MLRFILSGNLQSAIVYAISSLFVIFVTLPVHEFAHAFAANKLGDNTAKYQGRYTLNPLAHIDYIGALMIMLVGFGWAKPVPVNPRNFKNPKSGMAITAFAGPLSNLMMGFISMFLAQLTMFLLPVGTLRSIIILFFSYACTINISLAVFNLIPVPPLDGSRILSAVLPDRIYYNLMRYERYFYIVLLILLITGALTTPLNVLVNYIFIFFEFVTGLLFGF